MRTPLGSLVLWLVILLTVGGHAALLPPRASRLFSRPIEQRATPLACTEPFGGLVLLSDKTAKNGVSQAVQNRRLHKRQTWSGETPQPGHTRGGLSTSIEPRHYDLTLEPHFDTLTFSGRAQIDFDIMEDTDEVTLNSVGLNITSAILLAFDQEADIMSHDVSWNQSTSETLTFTLPDMRILKAEVPARLIINYTGVLGTDSTGFYLSRYTLPDGTVGVQAVSQFEMNDARTAFPCLDEPDLKQYFTVTILADKDLTCLSNMNINYEEEGESLRDGSPVNAVRFNTSPLMSTYLVSFAVGNFSYVESTEFHVPVRVYVPPTQDVESAKFALEVAVKGLKFYEQFTGYLFPLPKMDLVAVTEFGPGGMENWGMATFRSERLTFVPGTSAAARTTAFSYTILHEMAHMWFGDLVTLEWWDQIWLNEGFATYMAWLAMSKIYPDWLPWEEFLSGDLQNALAEDAIRDTHRVEIRPSDPSQSYFDNISYQKGAAVVRMLATHLGEDIFKLGLNRYLNAYGYDNAVTDDLWRIMRQVTNGTSDVVAWMNPWTKELGYPVLTVKEEGTTLSIDQHRFLLTGDLKPEDDSATWSVFLRLRSAAGVDSSSVLVTRDLSIELTPAQKDFYVLNADYTSFIRVLYPSDRFAKLVTAASTGALSATERIALISDANALATSGQQSTGQLLDLLSALKNETQYHVYAAMCDAFDTLRYRFRGDVEVSAAIAKLQRDVASDVARRVGWTFAVGDGHVQQQFKALAFLAAGLSGDEVVVQAAKDLYEKYMGGDEAAVNPNIRSAVIRIAMATTAEYIAAPKSEDSVPRLNDKRLGRFEGNWMAESDVGEVRRWFGLK